MRILAICIVKDEIDIVEQCLTAAGRWCDRIFVYDNGSTDGTWEAARAFAERSETVVPFKRDAKPFQSGLRSEVFHRHRSPGDWWCILDADEFYIDDPRAFIGQLDQEHDSIWSSSFEYCFTDVDLGRFRRQPSLYADHVPVEQKCRYYANTWSELRFFTDREDLDWPADKGQPFPLRCPCPRRIRLRHFQYRSPQQIQKRLDARAQLAERRIAFRHETREHWQGSAHGAGREDTQSWEERVVPSSELHFDAHDGNLVSDEDALPAIVPIEAPRSKSRLRRLAAKLRRLSKSPNS